jgi:ribonuclease HI
MKVFTDGGCWGNPGPGGWANIIEGRGAVRQDKGGEKATTNNRMELTAVIRALEFLIEAQKGAEAAWKLEPGEKIEIHTDSQYVQKGITEWIHGWMRNGWKTAGKDPVKNKELWQELWDLQGKLPLSWKWVKGHAGHPQNEACDALVQEAIGALG